MATVRLKQGEHRRIRSGHLWVFSNEVGTTDGPVEPGDVVAVVDAKGRRLGTGLASPQSLIFVRLFSRRDEDMTRDFLVRRIIDARSYRERRWPGETSYRAVYGESDLLPGLIVDRYGEVLVVQSMTAGIERRLDEICEILDEIYEPRAIVLRNDAPMRRREGLPLEKRVHKGQIDGPIEIEQDERAFLVDVIDGQKTGFFLDQRENRRATAPLARDEDVLDCCCYTGAWSVCAAGAGAKSVTGVDSSSAALGLATENAARNNLAERVQFVRGDMFNELARLGRGRRRFGLIILDPPSLARSRRDVREALKAVRALNRLALRLLRPHGHLVTCSCSHVIERDAFLHAVTVGAGEAGRVARILEVRGQGADHPVLLGLPETDYLACLVLEVM